jgi:hypothetical protein
MKIVANVKDRFRKENTVYYWVFFNPLQNPEWITTEQSEICSATKC